MNVTKAYRGLDKLTKIFKIKVNAFINDPRVKGKIFITESYRSQERQNFLYKQGRSKSGKIVTWTNNSTHTKGTAIDIAFIKKPTYPSNFYLWKQVAEVAKEYGIDWGYDLWGKDLPHFQCSGEPLDPGSKYSEIFSKIKRDGYKPVFNSHEGKEYLTEREVKELIEISNDRIFKKVYSILIKLFRKLKK